MSAYDDLEQLRTNALEVICTDNWYNFAHEEGKKVLRNQGYQNPEPARSYMIRIMMWCLDQQTKKILSEAKGETSFVFYPLTQQQMDYMANIAKKADGTGATVGAGAAGAVAGSYFGGFLGAVVGGIAGALFGKGISDNNRDKFNSVVMECANYYFDCLKFNFQQNNQAKIDNNGKVITVEKTDHVKEKVVEIEDINEVLKELNAMIGLKNVKKQINDLVNQVKVFKLRKEQGLPAPDMSYHMVFTGNPGTGKTTVARIVGKIYKALGILSKGQLVETERSDLVAEYVGQTAVKTKEVINKAQGGVLFIDEAYTLKQDYSNDFGQESIDTILKSMEDFRDSFIVIAAGYDNPMQKFINSNPGLKSRFKNFIHFDDYNGEELYEIFMLSCKKYNYKLTPEANLVLKGYFDWLYKNREENFGNGRDVRNLFEKIVTKQSQRVANISGVTKEQLQTIDTCDFDLQFKNRS